MKNREFREQLEDRTTQYAVEALPLTPPLLTPPLTHFYIGVCGVVGGKMVIELLAGTMRRGRGRIAAVGCSSMGAGSIGGKNYCGNLLWRSSLTQLTPQHSGSESLEFL